MNIYLKYKENYDIANLNTHILSNSLILSEEDISNQVSVQSLKEKVTVCLEELRDCSKDFDAQIFINDKEAQKRYSEFYLKKEYPIHGSSDDKKGYKYFIDKKTIKLLYVVFNYYEVFYDFDDKIQEFVIAILRNITENNDTSYEKNIATFINFIDKIENVVNNDFFKDKEYLPGTINSLMPQEMFVEILSNKTRFYDNFIGMLEGVLNKLKQADVVIELDTDNSDLMRQKFNLLLELLYKILINIKFNILIKSKMALNAIAKEISSGGYTSAESAIYSKEDADDAMKQIGDDAANIFDELKELPNKITQINRKFKMFRMKSKNYFFYRKYLGRIDHLYERYADDAKIKENKMNDDPVKILKEKATDYIERVSDEFTSLYGEIKNLAKQLENTGDPKTALGIVNKYLRDYKTDLEKFKEIPKRMLKATKNRVAQTLLEGNHIYGYTVESITEKKFPPANHTVVSLFVDNPHEVPQIQSVSDIVKSAESFKIIASNEKKPIFDISIITNNLVAKGVQSSDYGMARTARKNNISKMKVEMRQAKQDKDQMNPKLAIEQLKAIWSGVEKSFNYMIKMKKYIAQLIDGYFVMMVRIDNMMKVALTALLVIERERGDKGYMKGGGTGFKGDRQGTNKKYKQYDEDGNFVQRTDGDKDIGFNRDLSPRQELKQQTNEIKTAMMRQKYKFWGNK